MKIIRYLLSITLLVYATFSYARDVSLTVFLAKPNYGNFLKLSKVLKLNANTKLTCDHFLPIGKEDQKIDFYGYPDKLNTLMYKKNWYAIEVAVILLDYRCYFFDGAAAEEKNIFLADAFDAEPKRFLTLIKKHKKEVALETIITNTSFELEMEENVEILKKRLKKLERLDNRALFNRKQVYMNSLNNQIKKIATE